VAAIDGVAINGYYQNGAFGVGNTTRCLLDLGVLRPSAVRQPGRSRIRASVHKLWFEATLQFRAGVELAVHPYFSAACARKAVVFIHDAMGAGRQPDRLHRLTASRAQCLVTVSEASRRRLARVYGDRFMLFTQYPDLAFYSTPISRPDTPSATVGYWGGSADHKRVDLVGGLAGGGWAVWSTSPIAGVRHEHYPDVRQLVSAIDASTVAVYPSMEEGFGLPVYEAAARGVPVVVRRLPCYEDFVTMDDTLGVFAFDDDQSFGDAVKRAMAWRREPAPLPALKLPHLDAARAVARQQLIDILKRCGVDV